MNEINFPTIESRSTTHLSAQYQEPIYHILNISKVKNGDTIISVIVDGRESHFRFDKEACQKLIDVLNA
jgi:hypothetical protein